MGLTKPCECSGTVNYRIEFPNGFEELTAVICPDCLNNSNVTWTNTFTDIETGETYTSTFVTTDIGKPFCVFEDNYSNLSIAGKGVYTNIIGEMYQTSFTLRISIRALQSGLTHFEYDFNSGFIVDRREFNEEGIVSITNCNG